MNDSDTAQNRTTSVVNGYGFFADYIGVEDRHILRLLSGGTLEDLFESVRSEFEEGKVGDKRYKTVRTRFLKRRSEIRNSWFVSQFVSSEPMETYRRKVTKLKFDFRPSMPLTSEHQEIVNRVNKLLLLLSQFDEEERDMVLENLDIVRKATSIDSDSVRKAISIGSDIVRKATSRGNDIVRIPESTLSEPRQLKDYLLDYIDSSLLIEQIDYFFSQTHHQSLIVGSEFANVDNEWDENVDVSSSIYLHTVLMNFSKNNKDKCAQLIQKGVLSQHCCLICYLW